MSFLAPDFHLSVTVINQTSRTLHLVNSEASSGQWDRVPESIPPGELRIVQLHNSYLRGLIMSMEYSDGGENKLKIHYGIPLSGSNECGCEISGSLFRTDFEKHGRIPPTTHDFDRTITVTEGAQSEVNTASWMAEMKALLADRRLCDIIIPGSHDSATYQLYDIVAPAQDIPTWVNGVYALGLPVSMTVMGVLRSWAAAQGMSTYDQLRAGVRYLDFRVLKNPITGDFCACHALYGPSYTNIFPDVKRFLDEQPNEVVILDFNHIHAFSGPDDHRAFVALIKQHFGAQMFARGPQDGDGTSFTATLGDIWRARKQVVALYTDEQTVNAEPTLWRSDFPSAYGNKTDTGALIEYLEATVPARKVSGRFFATQLQLTPDTGVIALGVFSPGNAAGDLKILSFQTNPKLLQWLSAYSRRRDCNIVLMDWVSDALSRTVIHLNNR